MYNYIFIGIFLVSLLVHLFIFRKKEEVTFLIILTGVSFAFLTIDITLYMMLLDRYITVLFTILFILSLVLLTFSYRKDNQTENTVTRAVLYIVFNTMIGFVTFIVLPSLIMIYAYAMWVKIIIVGVYLGLIYLRSKVVFLYHKNHNDAITMIVLAMIPLVIAGRQSIYKMNEVYNRFEIDSSIIQTELLYDTIIVNPDINIYPGFGYDTKIINDTLFVYEFTGSYPNNDVLSVFDLNNGEELFSRSLRDYSEANVSVDEQAGDFAFDIDGDIIIVTQNVIFRYVDKDLEVLYSGNHLIAIEENEVLHFLDGDEGYKIEDGDIAASDYFDSSDGYELIVVDNTLIKKYGQIGLDYHYMIDQETYYGEDIYFVYDQNVGVGNYNQVYVSNKGVYQDIDQGLAENLVSCNGVYYSSWQSNWIINDYPRPMFFILDKDFKIQSAVLTTGLTGLTCSEDELYAKIETYDEEGFYIGTEYVRLDIETMMSQEQPLFMEYKQAMSEPIKNIFLYIVPLLGFAQYTLEKKKKVVI